MILRQAYRRVEIGTCSVAYPKGRVAYRPMLRVALHYRSKRFPMLAIVDTGADFTVFPSRVAEALGIEPNATRSIGCVHLLGERADCSLAPVTLVVNDRMRICSDVGFTRALSGPNIGLLGLSGFIDRLDRVTFSPQEHVFEIECSDGYRI